VERPSDLTEEALEQALDALRRGPEWAAKITTWRELPPQSPVVGAWPTQLDARLIAMLQARGIAQLYTHQVQAVIQTLQGRNTVIVTPTSSGKTLCYNLPVWQALLQRPSARALYLFPTKALAHDQLATLREGTAALGLKALTAAYDGDTPASQRARIRRQASVVVSNPDMLHVGMLPYHTQWAEFWRALEFVVVDEMHTYRGVFGSHVANVLRRLRRICDFYGSQPRFVCASATIANPGELASRLLEQPVTVIDDNGAPRGGRTMVFLNPPIISAEWGLRASPLGEARALANHLAAHGLQTVLFVTSRRAVEQLVLALRQDARELGLAPEAVRGYRGGYRPEERRAIEQGLRDGTVRTVVATNALELGVDVGGLQACVMAGYPGTIASTWQQAGRAGRGVSASLAVLVAADSPSDQYIMHHPDYFFGRSPEHALMNPDNLYVLVDHLRCAAAELPFEDGEAFGRQDPLPVLEFLAAGGEVRHSGGRWFWVGGDAPAAAVSLRSADAGSISIVLDEEGAERRLIGTLDRASAPVWVHEGAVYLHEGRAYEVTALDWEGGVAQVREGQFDYRTEASQSTRISIESVAETRVTDRRRLERGEIRLTTKATSYRKLRWGSDQVLAWGQINLPEQDLLTRACWLVVPEAVVERLREQGWWVGEVVESRGPNWPHQRDLARQRDGFRCQMCGAPERPERQHEVHHRTPFRDFGWEPGANDAYLAANQLDNLITLCPSCHRLAEQQVAVQSTLSGLSRVLGHVIPLTYMCDRHDIGLHTELKAPDTDMPTLFIYDAVPGGVGLSDEVLTDFDMLLKRAAELVQDCPCVAGCPSCIGARASGAPTSDGRGKEQVLRLIEALGGNAPPNGSAPGD
jgi:DEAD/DEAH box helicase domain-containing protein